MAMRWNWRKIGFGSGALIAAISTAYTFSPGSGDDGKYVPDKIPGTTNHPRYPMQIAHMKSGNPTPSNGLDRDIILQDAIDKSRALCERISIEKGLPGLTVAVTVNGNVVWKEGFGLSNLENNVPMKPESIMRIASISKSITMAMLAKLMEEGKIDIDKPIQTYLPNYPEKYVDGEKVTITTRHLLSHLSGIRHYHRKPDANQNDKDCKDRNISEKKTETKDSEVKGKKKRKNDEDEFDLKEYYLKEKFESVEDAMKLFQDDELFHKPGSKFQYTTHGWTVVSAIIEKLTETEFPKYCLRMFNFWGLQNTFLDLHEPIIYNRVSYYTRLKNTGIINAPYVDNSYKWAGGGFLSNVLDLTQFANILLYSIQTPEDGALQTCEKGMPKIPFLKQSTMKTMWTGNPVTSNPNVPDMLYALGFKVGEPLRKCMFCKERDLMVVTHDGGAIGASSSLLMIFPLSQKSKCCDENSNATKESNQIAEVNGVAVAMITNLTAAGLKKTAYEIAKHFKELI